VEEVGQGVEGFRKGDPVRHCTICTTVKSRVAQY
jgi:D-arabinose 1-dehydrogenase-like Zn-dependent alcohol dehydrogenase